MPRLSGNHAKMTDMLSFVDLRVMEALNAKPEKGLENALKQASE